MSARGGYGLKGVFMSCGCRRAAVLYTLCRGPRNATFEEALGSRGARPAARVRRLNRLHTCEQKKGLVVRIFIDACEMLGDMYNIWMVEIFGFSRVLLVVFNFIGGNICLEVWLYKLKTVVMI